MATYHLLLTYFLLYCVSSYGKTPNTVYMENNCGGSVSFTESVIFTMSNLTLEKCNVDLQSTQFNERVLINIQKFDLVDNCTDSSISILDQLGKPISGILCEQPNATIFKSDGNSAQFLFSTQSPDTKGRRLFVILTSFNLGVDGRCASGEFQCDNKLCIRQDLKCNGYDECSDGSDEANCQGPVTLGPQNDPHSTPVGLIIGLTLGIAGVLVGIFFIYRYRRMRSGYDRV